MRYFLLLLFLSNLAVAQPVKSTDAHVPRPKLVVGIVVDQMRWDYLYRYYDRYQPDGGFRRFLNKGFSCENTFIDYIPTYTACGHTSLYTGTVPAVHGITGNDWYDTHLGKKMYCAQDDAVEGVGGSGAPGRMSPRNMLTTTICDELRLGTNFESKVIGIAIKDRGGILPAGHSANAAYWYDGRTGNWISSTYYMKELPQWVNNFNNRKLVDAYYKQGWQTLYPLNSYRQSETDEQPYEGKPFGAGQTKFPYNFQSFVGKNYGAVSSTPFGNTMTKDMAVAAVEAEGLGKDNVTDFLAVSFSSTDYVGHSFGPNSIEVEDTYLRLDKDLGELFNFLDKQVGKGQYLVFLSADHGVAHVAGFSERHKLPGGAVSTGAMQKGLDILLRKKFGDHKFIKASANSQLYWDHDLLDSLQLDKNVLTETAIRYLSACEGVYRVYPTKEMSVVPFPADIRTRAVNGYFPSRSGDLQILLKPGYMSGGGTGTTHGSWNPYDAHIPLVWYGWNIQPGKTNRETYMTDVAPTLAALLRIQMPSGTIGNVIEEITGSAK